MALAGRPIRRSGQPAAVLAGRADLGAVGNVAAASVRSTGGQDVDGARPTCGAERSEAVTSQQ